MLILNKSEFRTAMQRCGFSSLDEVAEAAGIHRNTIAYYLSGKAVISEKLERVLLLLGLDLSTSITEEKTTASTLPQAAIAPLVDAFHAEFPKASLVLFGSRARSKTHKYSDFDLGVYSSEGLEHETYRKMRKWVGDAADRLPYQIDLVNLNNADSEFLNIAGRDWIFLAGPQQDWLDLNRRLEDGKGKKNTQK